MNPSFVGWDGVGCRENRASVRQFHTGGCVGRGNRIVVPINPLNPDEWPLEVFLLYSHPLTSCITGQQQHRATKPHLLNSPTYNTIIQDTTHPI